MLRRLACILILVLHTIPGPAQQPPIPAIDLEKFIEERFGQPQDDLPYEELYESLLLYYTKPLNLNKASITELESLQLLTSQQLQSFIRYRELNGNLLSLYELQAIPGFDYTTIEQLLPFVYLPQTALENGPPVNFQEQIAQADRYAILRYERVLQKRKGYLAASDSTPPAYAGSPDKLYFRFRLNRSKNLSLGLTAEKDAGERFQFSKKQYGMDFYSFHALLYNRNKFSSLAFGDYQAQWGQGLVFGAGFYLGKGSQTVGGIIRASTGLRPYTSVIENGYFRGAAFTYRVSRTMQLSILGSSLKNDAGAVTDTTEAGFAAISSIRSSGLHRTESELAGKNSVTENNAGYNLQFESKTGLTQLGVTGLYTRLNKFIEPLDRIYNRNNFSGRQHYINSIYGRHYSGSTSLFGELAYSTHGGLGTVTGITNSLSQDLSIAALFRYYSPGFYSFYGVSFSEGSRLQNETGLYFGLEYRLTPSLLLNAYHDRFWFAQPRYGIYEPSEGYENFIRLSYSQKHKLSVFAQYRHRNKARNLPETQVYQIKAADKHLGILNLDYQLNEYWSARSRYSFSWYRFNSKLTSGSVLLQDISYSRQKFKVSSRLAIFSTDDYENRQYVFEKDVLWAFSVPAYFGKGMRYYLLLQYKMNKNWQFWLRWAHTQYLQQNNISSGNNRIDGNKISQLKFQVKFSF